MHTNIGRDEQLVQEILYKRSIYWWNRIQRRARGRQATIESPAQFLLIKCSQVAM